MRAAGLHPIATLLTSEAVLIKSNKPDPAHEQLIDRISGRIAGVIAAGKYVLCNYNILRKNVAEATKITPGRRAATVSPLEDGEWVAVSSMVLRAEIADVMDRLQVSAAGLAGGVGAREQRGEADLCVGCSNRMRVPPTSSYWASTTAGFSPSNSRIACAFPLHTTSGPRTHPRGVAAPQSSATRACCNLLRRSHNRLARRAERNARE